jgi:hypothetical protein
VADGGPPGILASAAHARRFAIPGTAIVVASDDAPALRWLEEFLGPSFEVTAAREGDVSVGLVVNADRHARLDHARKAQGRGGASEAFFRLDQGVVRLLIFGDGAGGQVAYDPKFACFYALGAAAIEVIGHPGALGYRSGTMRMVREIATVRALAAGAQLLHAGGVVIGGGALALAGPKGGGKSTLLCHLAGTPGAALLANDRLLVYDGAPPIVRGMPTAVGLRPDTLAMFPRLVADLPAVPRPGVLTLEEQARHGSAERLDRARPIRISPAQLARGLGVPRVAVAPLRCVLFPARDDAAGRSPDGDDADVRRLSVAEARNALARARFGAGTDAEPTLFERRFGGTCPDPAPLEEALAARVPCFRVRARAATFTGGAVRAMVRRLGERPEPPS